MRGVKAPTISRHAIDCAAARRATIDQCGPGPVKAPTEIPNPIPASETGRDEPLRPATVEKKNYIATKLDNLAMTL